MTVEEDKKCNDAFAAFDKDSSGYIDASELGLVLKMMGQEVPSEVVYHMIADVTHDNSGKLSKEDFMRVIAEQKKYHGSSTEEDTLDCFVALGGQANKDGTVEASTLIDIIKDQFEMKIDIEKLIQEVDMDGSGKINFDEFADLLSSAQ